MVDWSVFANFGIAGLILGVFFVMLMTILKLNANTIKGVVDRLSSDARENNRQWRMTFSEHSNRADERQQESNLIMRELTRAINENNINVEKSWTSKNSQKN